MNRNDLEKYFDKKKTEYYNPGIIIIILEDIMGKTLDTTKNELENLCLSVDSTQIKEFLDKTFEEENPKLKKRIENPKQIKSGNKNHKIEQTKKYIEELSRRFIDTLEADRYAFYPYALTYFDTYSNIVRNKAKEILNIIEKIANKDCSTIDNLIVDLDIKLDEEGNITKEDICRLAIPFIYNYNLLVEKINTANNLNTYLTFKISTAIEYTTGCSEDELYPTSLIQVKNLFDDSLQGTIPLSDKQKRLLYKKQKKNIDNSSDFIVNLWG